MHISIVLSVGSRSFEVSEFCTTRSGRWNFLLGLVVNSNLDCIYVSGTVSGIYTLHLLVFYY